MTFPTQTWRRYLFIGALLASFAVPIQASDHADPIDLFNRERLEGGITDLFFFPDGDQMVVILCVRRALTQTKSLQLLPYTYSVHMDLDSAVYRTASKVDPPAPAAAPDPNRPSDAAVEEYMYRYGGRIVTPADIRENVTLSFRLMNDATLASQEIKGLREAPLKIWTEELTNRAAIVPIPGQINVWSGVADDPFIFPVFFGTNVVAIVTSIPKNLFPADQNSWLIWATSRIGERQVDHVGRSLRTQNPRFELLNTLHPKDHAAAVLHEHEHISLMRDLMLRIGFNSLFAYRRWDQQAADVMLFTTEPGLDFGNGSLSDGGARFPNGRMLKDDVAENLAQYGDTLLKEISYIAGGWPRATKNDKGDPNNPRPFPYLEDPWPDGPPRMPPMLSRPSELKLAAIAAGVIVLWFGTAWLFAAWLRSRRERRRYL